MSDSKSRSGGRVGSRMAQFVGGPLDGQKLPMRGDPHACVLRSSVDVNGTTIRWHWYRLVDADPVEWGGHYRYEFVTSESGDWPSDECPGGLY